MARRNQNTFLKRQKEMERVRKAKEKMARRQGKVLTEEVPSWAARVNAPAPDPDGAAETETDGAAAAEPVDSAAVAGSPQEPGGEKEPEA